MLFRSIVHSLFAQSKEALEAGDEVRAKAKREEAVQQLLEGNKNYPDNYYLLIELINYYLLGDNPVEAEQHLDRAIEQSKKTYEQSRNEDDRTQLAQFYRAKGTLYDKLERSLEAEQMYLKTLELAPNDFLSHYQLGNIQLDRVTKEHQKLDEITDTKEYHKGLERIMKMYEGVIPYFESALAASPEDINAITTLSRLYFQLRNLPQKGPEYTKKYEEMRDLLKKD